MLKNYQLSLDDLRSALFVNLHIALSLGWNEIAQRYRRSSLGPIWITISMGVTVLGMGLIFGTLFNLSLKEFLPFLAVGMITWTFIVSSITEGCKVFTSSEAMIRQFSLPFHLYVFKLITSNSIIFLHNLAIFPVIILLFLIKPNWLYFIFIPGYSLLIINLVWISLVFGIVCARFRDISQLTVSILQLCFFVTPIIWQPSLMIERGRAIFMDVNPFFHLIEVVRSPLMGQMPTVLNWGVCLGMAVVGWAFALGLLGAYRKRIAYWL